MTLFKEELLRLYCDNNNYNNNNNNNKVAGYIQWTMLQLTNKVYEHTPERVLNANGTTIMGELPVFTDRTVLANRPDIALYDKKEKTCPLIDMAITDDSNINTKETEKISHYKELEFEFTRLL